MPITILVVIISLFDLLIVYKSWAEKPWLVLVASDDGGFRVVSVWHWSDTLFLIVFVLFQLGLAYIAYRAWTFQPEGRS
jgi:hypothetical protein